jgi:hypothetical protein
MTGGRTLAQARPLMVRLTQRAVRELLGYDPAKTQQRERQYMADYYARTTREQEERENREARERFAASQRNSV